MVCNNALVGGTCQSSCDSNFREISKKANLFFQIVLNWECWKPQRHKFDKTFKIMQKEYENV